MNVSQEFLIVRGDDLVVLGLRWLDMELLQGPPDGPPRLRAMGDDARIVLTFPPQSIAEEKFTEGAFGRRRALLAGTSHIEFSVRVGTTIELTAEGVLQALQTIVARGNQESQEPTAIEMPWGLIVSVATRSDGADILSDHSARPIVSPNGVRELWHARLRASDGTATDAGLALLPLDLNRDDIVPDAAPLSGGQRQSIFDAIPTLAHVRRLELSALGGSLSARLVARDLQWDHDMTLGRDQRVRVLVSGVLYPFGHRAVYSVLAERVLREAGQPSSSDAAGSAIAGMERQQILAITEPIRATNDVDAILARKFPFREVEICTRSFTDLALAHFETYQRTPFPDTDLQDDIRDAQDKLATLLPPFEVAFDAQPRTLDDYIERDLGSSPELKNAIIMNARDPDAMQREQDKIKDDIIRLEREQHVPNLSEEAAEAIFEALAEARARLAEVSNAVIAQVRAEAPFWATELLRLKEVVKAEFEATDTLDEFIAQAAGADPTAELILVLQERIATRQREIDAIQDEAKTEHDLYWLPRTSDGKLIRFPMRCAGANGDVYFSVPLIFVRDFELHGPEHFPDFASLTDEGVAGRLSDEWVSNSVIPLPGVRIDPLHNTPTPNAQPGDVHEVHQITIARNPQGGTFCPSLTEFLVDLPALRTLLPGVPERIALKYSDKFLEAGDGIDLVLETVDPNGIAINFADHPERSGGLVSPSFRANAISRTLGPVTKAAVPIAGEFVPDPSSILSSVYKDATLLSFPLAKLIKTDSLEGLPKPPKIIPVLENGKPIGARMEWKGLSLQNLGPLQVIDRTKIKVDNEESTLGDIQVGMFARANFDKTTQLAKEILARHDGEDDQGADIKGVVVSINPEACTLQIRPKVGDTVTLKIGTEFVLGVESSQNKTETTCSVSNFSLLLPPVGTKLLKLHFASMVFTQRAGHPPELQVKGFDVELLGALALLKELENKLKPFLSLAGPKPTIAVVPSGITVDYAFGVPSVTAGTFLLRNIAMRVGVEVPFSKNPVSVSLGFASRENPFNLTVLMFGGGGYIDVRIRGTGIELEASMEFGAMIAVDFVAASGEVHAMGGVHFLKEPDNSFNLEAYIRIGGSVQVLGLVSVAVELRIELEYEDDTNRLVGHASLVIEIDVTFFSKTVTLDSGEWVLQGSEVQPAMRVFEPEALPLEELEVGARPAAREDPALAAWRRYRRAFEEESKDE